MTSVATKCTGTLGHPAPVSIVLDDARLLERMQVGLVPPKPNLLHEIDKHKSNEHFNNAWCPHGAALSMNDQTPNTTETFE